MSWLICGVWAAIAAVLPLTACGDQASVPDGGVCIPGNVDCACTAASDCHDGLTCDDGLCRGEERVGVSVLDPSARSCEAIVDEESGEVFGVEFGGGVRGMHVREAPRTAVAFHGLDDSSFEPGAAIVRRSTGGTLQLRRARCFDREGNALPGEPLRLEE